tara:strand:+ start:183 stop:1949 length:1767 start_codon:yes stop_codon:yes gene_type:complete
MDIGGKMNNQRKKPEGFGHTNLETKVYVDFKREVYSLLETTKRFISKQIKILKKQMSIGKSYLQGKELPKKLKEVFPEMKFIFRVCPTTEVAGDGVFDKVILIEDNYKYKYRPLEDIGKNALEDYLNDLLENDNVYCFTFTHALLADQFEIFLKFAEKSVLIIEEAHQFVGCGDAGSPAYTHVGGYGSNYKAKTAGRIREWTEVNGRVMGFTATSTLHHEGDTTAIPGTEGEVLSDLFDTVNDLAPRKDLISSQAWLGNTKQYFFRKREPQVSVTQSVKEAIDSLVKREDQLNELRQYDKNITSKLTGLFVCGTARGVWGCPIHANEHVNKKTGKPHDMGMVEIISDHLVNDLGYDPSLKMIATLQEKGAGGNRVWDLTGDKKNCQKVKTFEEIKKRMLDPNDPLRYLIVVNRARSGISINNLGAMVVGVVRDPQMVRTAIPLQVYGRMLRANPGTGPLITDKYYNNLDQYTSGYIFDNPEVSSHTMLEAMRISNHFDLWYPLDIDNGPNTVVWRDALQELKENYVNTLDEGLVYYSIEKPDITDSFLPLDLEIEVDCDGVGTQTVNLNEQLLEWKGDGTLERFFQSI